MNTNQVAEVLTRRCLLLVDLNRSNFLQFVRVNSRGNNINNNNKKALSTRCGFPCSEVIPFYLDVCINKTFLRCPRARYSWSLSGRRNAVCSVPASKDHTNVRSREAFYSIVNSYIFIPYEHTTTPRFTTPVSFYLFFSLLLCLSWAGVSCSVSRVFAQRCWRPGYWRLSSLWPWDNTFSEHRAYFFIFILMRACGFYSCYFRGYFFGSGLNCEFS